MAIYFFIYIISFIFSYCYSKCESMEGRVIFCLLTFLSLFLPLALRYNIGTDYKGYMNVLVPALEGNYNNDWEIMWTLLIKFMRSSNSSPHFFFVVGAFITLFFAFKTFDRKYFYLCIPVFVSIQYIESFSIVRQACAVAISLYGLNSYISGGRLKGFIYMIFAVLFHSSTAFYLLIIPFYEFKYKYINRYLCIFIFIITYILFQILHMGTRIFEIFGTLVPYVAIYMSSGFNKATQMGSGLGLLLRELLVFGPLLFIEKEDFISNVSKINVKNEKSLEYNSFFILSLLMFGSDILSGQIHIFNRLVNLFTPVYVYEIQLLARSKNKYKRIIIIWLIMCYFLLFSVSIFVEKSSNKGGLGISPYQSIFSK